MSPLLFTSKGYVSLGKRLIELSGNQKETSLEAWEEGLIERREFPDGESYQRLATDCRDREVVLLGGTISNASTLELYDLACAIAYYGAKRLTMVNPFFGYSTMERAERPGEVVVAKTRARLFSSVPPASNGNRMFLLDLHAEGITHYFEGSIQPVHLSARSLMTRLAQKLGGDEFVLACTDAGRAKWVESMANQLGVAAAFAYKRRNEDSTSDIVSVSAHVQGKTVVLYDDMIRTGSSLISAARAYIDKGATEVHGLTTHGVFPDGALEKIQNSGFFASISCTDSHPRALELEGEFLKVHSIASVLDTAIRKGASLGVTC